MGMPRGGSVTSNENGPSLGRGLGLGSTFEQLTLNGPTSRKQIGEAIPGMQGMEMNPDKADVSKDANSVPGFPQDAYMEGPMMTMDKMVSKPENYGLRPGWSGFVQGMTMLVRVLPTDQYNRIMELRSKQSGKPEDMPGMNMPK